MEGKAWLCVTFIGFLLTPHLQVTPPGAVASCQAYGQPHVCYPGSVLCVLSQNPWSPHLPSAFSREAAEHHGYHFLPQPLDTVSPDPSEEGSVFPEVLAPT